ncbi:P-loop containing nucleoside triphosphate hydrolase protein [Piptocephalis cylindrospora]|uniref:DNA 3'-5' helicase n=1 Tax=Piptocephalis cylindrospora TaxID=1907219 RepID=A0A4P9YA26_9FUNG|nr:P-loop containing nucleoside triphosphate hydrolase protein [Piptocephalis cylindrospora]|eukprot:RKP14900.1 P-loop containing nucleoside triphosphate hydrolase protein [Piptocephalis cylindrospora]
MSIQPTKNQLQKQLRDIAEDLAQVDKEMEALITRQEQLEAERAHIISQIEQAEVAAEPLVEYDTDEGFPWSERAREKALSHWGISSWRGVQRPVINAAMRGKDIIAILPTGGGKSLCYQLPAILAPENQVSLVVSPLISLIHDQVYHLSRAHVDALALTSASSRDEVAHATAVLAKGPIASAGSVRLIYVTPERIAKSKRFIGALEKCYRAGNLGRIVPPAPPSVMASVVEVLGMRYPGKPKGALLFTMPLFRPNLHYGVLAKPLSADAAIQGVGKWIINNWPKDRGIVYCMTRREVDVMAKGLHAMGIPVGSYYSDVTDDAGKALSHASWREGAIRVMVATTAFGMGIDQPNVRYVLHFSPSKSLDGYYQETGRGGRDGLKTDCILWYHPRDQSRLSCMGVTDHEGLGHVYGMIRYAEEGGVCRKQLFDQYFKHSSGAGAEDSISEAKSDEEETCGHCDVCTHQKTAVWHDEKVPGAKDVWEEARMICNTAYYCRENEKSLGRVTALKLVKEWKKNDDRSVVHQEEASLGKWTPPGRKWTITEGERLVVRLLLGGYLREDFHFTAFSTIA